ncbi:MAG: 1,4-alpha-glucan branching enzyme, partial [Boseongicola sp.]|nr:1,4-alpha-glucan branching enzyme [Boseongicola sp.]
MMPPDDARKIAAGTHADPFSVLGPHVVDGRQTIRVFTPGATRVEVLDASTGRRVMTLDKAPDVPDVFVGRAARRKEPFAYLLRITKGEDQWVAEDPYRFGPVLGALD